MAVTGPELSKCSGIPVLELTKDIRGKLTSEMKKKNPAEFQRAVDIIVKSHMGKKPNDAHIALAEYKIPVITLNIDMLHQKAGSGFVAELHGNAYQGLIPYGDIATDWDKAADLINSGNEHDVLLVIGMPMNATIISDLIIAAISRNMHVIEIRKNITHKVRKVIEKELQVNNGDE